MHIQHLDPEKLVHAYNVDLQVLYPWEGVVTPPFGAAWAIVAPGEETKVHKHQEGETFFIVRGRGVMTVDGTSEEVGPGSVVFQDPFHAHVLRNTSDDEELMFLTVWWEDRELWPKDGEDTPPADDERPARRVMVTAAPPTPNGDLHLGHLSGPYLAADFHTRYLRLRGDEGYYACGTDDHCMYVERMGESLGLDGHEAGRRFVQAITETLDMAGIETHVFMDPDASPYFKPRVDELFDRLYRAGILEVREGPSPYCEDCERYLFEADVRGGCPHCGEEVTGNTCEPCGRINDAVNLVKPCCTACGKPAATRDYKRLFFPLSRYAEKLTRYHRGVSMNAHLRSFCERLIADGLPDVAVTHVSGWGYPVPVDEPGFEEQAIYVWFEMAARYWAYAEHLNDVRGKAGGYGSFWRSEDASIVQFFGFDNSFYYAVLLPAIYLAFDEGDGTLRLPRAFVCNEFYRLDGEKFSTSRGHSILGRTLLAAAPRDTVRFYLAWSSPEREETNFTLAEFEDTVERELVGSWQPWLAELGAKVRAESDGKVPATGDWTDEQRRFHRDLEKLLAEAAEAYEPEAFSPQRAVRLAAEVVRTARRFGRSEGHWRDVAARGEEYRTTLALELLAAKVLALVTAPVMPEFAGRLWRDLGYDEALGAGCWETVPAWVPAGQRLGELGREYFVGVRGCLAPEKKAAA